MGIEEHLKEISFHIPKGRHGVVIMDRAGWHTKLDLQCPDNISLLFLPAYAPELNPQENVWQHLKDTYLANRVFHSSQEIRDVCCDAWNSFAKSAELIDSITFRNWIALI